MHRIPFYGFFGGTLALSKEHVVQINGFSNVFYGWGGEDDEALHRYDGALC